MADQEVQDRISALPDGVLELILSFLPAHEAVQTSVLARSWRDIWTRSPGLHITGWGTVDEFIEFVDELLRLRSVGNGDAAWAPLDSCHFYLSDFDTDEEEDETTTMHEAPVDEWIQCALRCQVRELRFHCEEIDRERLVLGPNCWPLASEYLTKLELSMVSICEELDFSGCPALLDLEIDDSYIAPEEIWSPSLQHLSITLSDLYLRGRTRIRTPSLVSLTLSICGGQAPFLEKMPSLESAVVTFEDRDILDKCFDTGTIQGCGDECDGCPNYYGRNNDRSSCVLLSGLSEATNLMLSAPPEVFVFSRDIKYCPTFRNLKTLVLVDWFVADDFSGLIGFLQHSPILEKLTLDISEMRTNFERTEGRCKPLEPSVVSDRLRTAQIKCREVDAMVIEILNILVASGVPLEQINIQSSPRGSGRAKFKCIGLRK